MAAAGSGSKISACPSCRRSGEVLDKSDIIVCRKMDYAWQVLVSDRERIQNKYPKAMVVPTTIDEIMLLYVKGEKG